MWYNHLADLGTSTGIIIYELREAAAAESVETAVDSSPKKTSHNS
jgi:hypothetical protein